MRGFRPRLLPHMHWFYALAPYKASEAIFSLLFPLYLLNVFHLQAGPVGLLTALISLTSVPGSVLWGHWSDRLQVRRPFLIVGCVGSSLCLLGMGLVTAVLPLVPLCLLYGAFSIALSPVASVLIMETVPQERWEEAFGTFNKISGWGWIVGLATGTWLLPLLQQGLSVAGSMRLLFALLAGAKLAAAWWVYASVPEPLPRVPRHHYVTVTRRLPPLTLIERALYLPRQLLFTLSPAHLRQLRALVPAPLRLYLGATLLIFFSSTMVFTPLPLFLQQEVQLGAAAIFCPLLAAHAGGHAGLRAGRALGTPPRPAGCPRVGDSGA
ncbi:MAG: hypothetical protein KatS3mg131_1195 [Candidatus Tectimicrobiota bacterium]|nr:MAG: hypothetical protein KatS3mg131_1195 [Candidatus Tectomicrobia bacterium]